MQLYVTPRYLIVVAVLAGGCEQLRSPKRLRELEGRVDELSSQVAAIQAKPGAGSGSAGSGAGSAEAVPAAVKPEAKITESPDAKPEPAPDTKTDTKPPEADPKPDDKPAPADGTGSGSAAPAVAAIGPSDAAGKPATADAPVDAGAGTDGGITSDPAFEKLLSVVAQNTARTRPNEPTSRAARWDYDGKSGPAGWAALDPAWRACGTGVAQSPVDIEPRAATSRPIVFHYQPTPATVTDNGHTLQVDLAPGSSIELGDAVYQLVQFQFHAPSEHTIAGEHYPLEVQLVHKDAAGKLAMISVLYDAGAESRPLAGVWAAWPRKVGVGAPLARPFDPSTLLPETRTAFRYTGSLTTPPCTEGVVWSVMRRTLSDTKAHLAVFSTHYAQNARDIQALGDRKIE